MPAYAWNPRRRRLFFDCNIESMTPAGVGGGKVRPVYSSLFSQFCVPQVHEILQLRRKVQAGQQANFINFAIRRFFVRPDSVSGR